MSNEINQQINLLINKDKSREQELSFNKLKKDFDELNLQELRQDLQILDLKYIKIQEVNYILKIMNRNRWTVKDLYKLFYEGSIDTIKSLVCCKNLSK